ncbi:MAG: DUF4956 domain-containing protein [Spirochaetales bacterium]|nr:DUF4956 domain-containing protein [Spirochaetales bacterium]
MTFDIEFNLQLFVRFLVNLLFLVFLIRRVYSPTKKDRKYPFVFFNFNILVFFIASFLSTIKMETGFAFGLFAIFSIIRYRTEQIPIKEMTFLFISIILATINSTVTREIDFFTIIIANIVILLSSYFMEKIWLPPQGEPSPKVKKGKKKSGLREESEK